MDLSRAGWLRTVVDSANGFRMCGSRCTTVMTTTPATITATVAASPVNGPMILRAGAAGAWAGAIGVGSWAMLV